MSKNITIVGAGLVGSLWAVFLAKRGYQVEVYERRPDMRKANIAGGRSINLALSHRGWKALEKAGLKAAVMQEAIPMKGRMMHSTEGELTFQPYGKEGEAIYSVSRGGLNRQLMDLAEAYESVDFHFNHRCLGWDRESNILHFQDAEGQKKEVKANYIFACDGAFSAVRSSMQRSDRFNYSQYYLPHGYKELTIPATADGQYAMEPNALHIWPRGEFMLIALPNPDKTFTCTLFLPFEGAASFESLQSDEGIMAFFQKYFADAIPLMPTLLEDFKKNPTSSLVTIRCAPWQQDGKALLIGDASHAIVPFYGQGMNSGFEDCTLLDELADELDENWDTIIPTFAKNRVEDGNAIADLALRNFVEMRDWVADPQFLLRKKIAGWLHETYPKDFIPLYSMVTFSHIPYAAAWQEGLAQDQLFERILAIPNVAENWKGDKVVEVFQDWLAEKKG